MAGYIKPPASRLKQSHPLARGLLRFYAFDQAVQGRYVDKVMGAVATSTGSSLPIFRMSEQGFNVASDGTSRQITIPSFTLPVPCTLSFRFRVDAIDSAVRTIYRTNGVVQAGMFIWSDNTVTSYDSPNFIASHVAAIAGTTYSVTQVINGASSRVAVNGTFYSWNSGFTSAQAGALAMLSDPFSQHLKGGIYSCAIWNRGLTDSEIATLHRDPWVLYAPQESRNGVIGGFSAGGGGGNPLWWPARAGSIGELTGGIYA
jgi:hypothetical protein